MDGVIVETGEISEERMAKDEPEKNRDGWRSEKLSRTRKTKELI
jgi:hypothetical protein